MSYTSQWTNSPPGASGSRTTKARLLVPLGSPSHLSAGDVPSPSQLYVLGMGWLSLNDAELSRKSIPTPVVITPASRPAIVARRTIGTRMAASQPLQRPSGVLCHGRIWIGYPALEDGGERRVAAVAHGHRQVPFHAGILDAPDCGVPKPAAVLAFGQRGQLGQQGREHPGTRLELLVWLPPPASIPGTTSWQMSQPTKLLPMAVRNSVGMVPRNSMFKYAR